MSVRLHVLIIEDSGDDAQLMVRTIQSGGYDVQYERVETEAALKAALQSGQWDVILCDYTLPALNAVRVLEMVKAEGRDLPFIIVSGSIGEEMAIAALRAGAHDFMLKGNLARLVPAIQRELQEVETRRERSRAQTEVHRTTGFLETVIETANVMFVQLDPAGNVVKVNSAAEEITGYSRTELQGRNWGIVLIPPERHPQAGPDFELRAGNEHDTGTFESPILTKQGEERTILWKNSVLREDGHVTGTISFGIDITERMRAEAALGDAEARYRLLVEQLPMIVYVGSAQDVGDAVYVSPQAEEVLGYSKRDWLRDPAFWQTAIHPDDRQRVKERIEHTNRTQEPFDMQYRMIARDGSVLWFRDQASPVRDASGKVVRWQGLMVDVTKARQREREWEAIARLSQTLRQTQTVQEILPRLLDETLALMDSEQGSIWLRDPLGEQSYMAEQRQWNDESMSSYASAMPILDLVITRGQTIVQREIRSDPRVPEEQRRRVPPGIGGACVPLTAAGKAVGAMFVNVRLPREITPDELRVLAALADLGAYAIHRAQLFDETTRHLDRLAALRSIDLAISSSFDLQMVLNVVLDNVLRDLKVDAASILLLKADTLMLEFAAGKGFWGRAVETSSLSAGEGLPGRAVLERDITYVDDLRATREPISRPYLISDEKFVSYYGVPLVAKGRVKGVLEIFNRSPLKQDAEWMRFLDALAGQTAIAIDSSSTFQDLQRSNTELALAYDATIAGWSHMLDLRDRETEGHTLRVTEMALKLARAMGMDDEALVQMRRGGLLHDIGKMAVPDSVLLKPGRLNDREWAIMRRHPQFAYDMLSSIPYLRPALDIPYCHHERWDGAGYPRSLKGNEIPFSARIFSVVDVWDALSSDRPYRPGHKLEAVLEYIRQESGKQFDPAVVEAFVDLMTLESFTSPLS